MSDPKEIVDEMISALSDRGGFDGWWDGIDAEDQEDIKQELVEILVK